jgi:hypothetical protein
MKLTLHHINLCLTNVPAMDEFYRSVLGMSPEPSLQAMRDTTHGDAGDVAFVTDDTTQVHIAEKDLAVGFRTGQAVNPLERGHSRLAPTISTPSSAASTRSASRIPTMARGR